MADNSIFRKKSLERVQSPEQLNDYIKVANPGVWLVLIAVIIFLAGMIAWGQFGRLETTVKGAAVISGGEATFYLPESGAESVKAGQTVRVGDSEYTLESLSAAPVEVDAGFDTYLVHAGGFAEGDWVYTAKISGGASEDGIFGGEIVTDSVSPLSFVMN